uniref:Uncharacterized protein n=1 Tax=Borrelia hermsii TaxID=140 RepID=S4VN62_BORHE|nr:hypothetical protein BHA166 [Borrelia hermsii]
MLLNLKEYIFFTKFKTIISVHYQHLSSYRIRKYLSDLMDRVWAIRDTQRLVINSYLNEKGFTLII